MEQIGNLIDLLYVVLNLVWAFKARNRINQILETGSVEANWFNGIWTFIFRDLYINYKVNTIKETL